MIRIKRITVNEYGTFGVLLKDGVPMMTTLECLPLFNHKNISCIPAGFYECEQITVDKLGDCILIKNVPDRDSILIHTGNTIDDIEGCILVGFSFGKVSGLPAVLSSRNALKKLLSIVPNEFVLEIQNCYL